MCTRYHRCFKGSFKMENDNPKKLAMCMVYDYNDYNTKLLKQVFHFWLIDKIL